MKNKLDNLLGKIDTILHLSGCDIITKNRVVNVVKDSLIEYGSLQRFSKQLPEKYIKKEKEYSDKKMAFSICESLLENKCFQIEDEDPYEFGEKEEWSYYEDRRRAKLWVLK